MQIKSKRKKTPLIWVIQTNRIIQKQIKPNENQSIAKLGTAKSHTKIVITFDFSKMNILYRIHT